MQTTVLRGRKQTLSDNDFSDDEYGAWLDEVVVTDRDGKQVTLTVDQFRKMRPSRRSRGLGIYQDRGRVE